MTTPTLPTLSPAARRFLWVLLLVFGVVFVAIVVAYISKKQSGQGGGAQGQNTQSNQDGTPVTPGNTQPVPPANTSGGAPSIPTPVIVPTSGIDPMQVNLEYVKMIAWKTRDSIYAGKDYRCEVTNGVVEMGDMDLKALILLYKQYYNGSFQTDYCNNWQSSGCTFSWFESKHETACNRLKNLIG